VLLMLASEGGARVRSMRCCYRLLLDTRLASRWRTTTTIRREPNRERGACVYVVLESRSTEAAGVGAGVCSRVWRGGAHTHDDTRSLARDRDGRLSIEAALSHYAPITHSHKRQSNTSKRDQSSRETHERERARARESKRAETSRESKHTHEQEERREQRVERAAEERKRAAATAERRDRCSRAPASMCLASSAGSLTSTSAPALRGSRAPVDRIVCRLFVWAKSRSLMAVGAGGYAFSRTRTQANHRLLFTRQGVAGRVDTKIVGTRPPQRTHRSLVLVVRHKEQRRSRK